MASSRSRQWWRRLRLKWPWRRPGLPPWGARPPIILGVCQECGAAVLEGWHQEVPGGFRCQRCAHRSSGR